MPLFSTLRRAWRRYVIGPAATPIPGGLTHAAPVRIADGVDYRRPVMLPGAVRDLPRPALQAFLADTGQSYAFQFDLPYRSAAYDGPVQMPTEDPLVEWDFETRRTVLTNCHAAFQRNPLAKRAVVITQQFAVGKGMSLACHNAGVAAVLDAFRNDPENNVREYEKTLLQDLAVDGELFIRLFADEAGRCLIVPVRPWHVAHIETAPGFFRRVDRYHLQYSASDPHAFTPAPDWVDEWVPAPAMLHVAINRHSYELRGRPDLYVILPWLRAYKDWIENRARQNHWRGALLWDVTLRGAGPQQVTDARERYRHPPTPGSIAVHSDREEWKPLTADVKAADASEDGRQMRMMSVVGMGLAEYMLGDGENANRATATAQELPALWKFTDAQSIMVHQVWEPVFRWVIGQAVLAGQLDERVRVEHPDGTPILNTEGREQFVAAADAFTISYPELGAKDPRTLAEALAIATAHGWVSQQTAAGRMGFDWATEQRRIAREQGDDVDGGE